MQKPFVIAGVGAALLVAVLLGAFLFSTGGGASATKSQIMAAENVARQSATVSAAEANAWAEARATDTKGAYGVYLAAFPDGAFVDDARDAIDRVADERAERREKFAAARTASPGATPRRRNVAAACRSYVDQTLSKPSRVGRTVGGAAAGCAVGALAGGNDGRNCAVGAVAGGVTGAVSAESRERRRMQEVQYCIANGGPPR
jgi:uncharacterized protein YcfJ